MQSKNITRSEELFLKAQTLLPGGVDSPVRAFRSVGSQPLFIDRGEGAYVFDVDGNRYLDYVLSWGPLILGHANDAISRVICETARKGTSFGAPSPLELELAKRVMGFYPSMERVRFVNSGTEATMSAIRLARAYTKRDYIIKFEGCYHGHADIFLVQAGSGVATLGLPDSPGVPAATANQTLIAPYNDLEAVKKIFQNYPQQIAAIIVEPVAGNMGVVPPVEGFLQGLRTLSEEYNALLIFDEIMTGFRVHRGGAQALYNIKPDLTTLGKVIGGGVPVGAFGGRQEIMDLIAPAGPVYQAGTFSGNPLAMAAGVEILQILDNPAVWENLNARSNQLKEGVISILRRKALNYQLQSVGSMFTLFFAENPVTNWTTASLANREKYAQFFRNMLDYGVYLAPSQFEAGFLSSMHGEHEILFTLEAIEKSLV
ncbi:MAG: glutamate-1-semialdehyde-2,1-aminomutase [Chloroflexi bacterium HGW-Chloroflexi-2]|jgi:glutamate-1-semialdehyde 2,1-aminomutase|nr:MAG: glutamate-1-semialdehyde-2,1-aminomutase [Chloroflexi bacterium HGW-Chloroflexi-2]